MRRAALLSVVFALAAASPAAAQRYIGRAVPRAGSVEISGGASWTLGYDAGQREAVETRGGTTESPLTLFATASEVKAAPGGEARVGVYLSPRLAVEGTLRFSRPSLQTRISDDFENASPITAAETVSSYLAGGTLLYHFGRGPLVPFVSGGGGYLRQLHEENAVVLTGTEIHAGGGVKYWLGNGKQRVGLRIDAQASSRSKSIGFDEKRRVLPSVTAGLSYVF